MPISSVVLKEKSSIIKSIEDLDNKLDIILSEKGPHICEVKLDPNYKFSPKLSSLKKEDGTMISKPLEDLYPFLDREEFKSNMIIEMLD